MMYALYIASGVGALALYLMMPRPGYNPKMLGALLGALVLGSLWLYLSKFLPDDLGLTRTAFVYYYIFSALAIASAIRVITHTKPVYAALWFVMVVLASSGLCLVLNAEFIALAMVIIYAGAILVTYVFVLMLAAQPPDPNDPTSGHPADRLAFEPIAAIAAGFLLMAVLLSVAFTPMQPNPAAIGQSDRYIIAHTLTDLPADRLIEHIGFELAKTAPPSLVGAQHLDNTQRLGLDLFRGHPLGLELAGVILLVSLVGAVVMSNRRLPTDAAQQDPGHTQRAA